MASKWGKVCIKQKNRNVQEFKNEDGFEQIATALDIPHPAR
jgi:hypothetical protein